MEKILQFAHSLIKNHINNDDIFIDMTIGNGKDTLYFLHTQSNSPFSAENRRRYCGKIGGEIEQPKGFRLHRNRFRPRNSGNSRSFQMDRKNGCRRGFEEKIRT